MGHKISSSKARKLDLFCGLCDMMKIHHWMGIKVIPTLKNHLLVLLFFFSICASVTILSLVFRCGFTAKSQDSDIYFKEIEKPVGKFEPNGQEAVAVAVARRRVLSGLGSSPPRCAWKCGRCTPCKPVHVAVPPGTPVTAEYYPEAWRCKCGNKLYMP